MLNNTHGRCMSNYHVLGQTCSYQHQDSFPLYASDFATEAEEEGRGEKMAFYCLYQLANSTGSQTRTSSLSSSTSLTIPHLVRTASLSYSFHVAGKVSHHNTAHPVKPIVNSSSGSPLPAVFLHTQTDIRGAKQLKYPGFTAEGALGLGFLSSWCS